MFCVCIRTLSDIRHTDTFMDILGSHGPTGFVCVFAAHPGLVSGQELKVLCGKLQYRESQRFCVQCTICAVEYHHQVRTQPDREMERRKTHMYTTCSHTEANGTDLII